MMNKLTENVENQANSSHDGINKLVEHALLKQQVKIKELTELETQFKHREETIQQKAELIKEKEKQLQKNEKILDGTNQKLCIRKAELDKEWERLDQLRRQLDQREL